MATLKAEITDGVARLIGVCRDAEKRFAAACGELDNSQGLLKSEFLLYSRQRRDFASELEQEMDNLGQGALRGGTWGGALHRGWMEVRSALNGHDRAAILAECLRGEEQALSAYLEVLGETPLSGSLADSIQMQYQAVRRVHDRITSLCSKP